MHSENIIVPQSGLFENEIGPSLAFNIHTRWKNIKGSNQVKLIMKRFCHYCENFADGTPDWSTPSPTSFSKYVVILSSKCYFSSVINLKGQHFIDNQLGKGHKYDHLS